MKLFRVCFLGIPCLRMKFATFQQAFEFNLIADSQSLIEPFCEGNKHGMYQGVYTEESMESVSFMFHGVGEYHSNKTL